MNTIVVGTHRRPEYLRQTLDALSRCHSVDGWDVVVLMDRPDIATREIVMRSPTGWATVEIDLANQTDAPYSRISAATLRAFALGFATSDFVVHLEEDCVPARDFLDFMAAQADRYRNDPNVGAVSAWWPAPPEWGDAPPASARYATSIDVVPVDGIATWGVGTWIDRWPAIRRAWNPHYWDRNLAGKAVVHPLVARVRNIGREGTQPVDEHDWRNLTQTPAFLPNAPAGAWSQM